MTIAEAQEEIIDEFALLGNDWEQKYEYIIEGCQSQVWISPEYKGGKVHFEGDSDAIIVRGLVAMVLRVVNNQAPADIAQSDLYFPQRIGMDRHLAPTRSNGLAAMIKQIKLYGLALSLQEE